MPETPLHAKEIYASSVSRWFDPFVSVAIIAAAFLAFRTTMMSDVHLALLMVFAPAAYLFMSELSRAPWSWATRPHGNTVEIIERTLTKFLGILVGIAAILFAVWLFPEYDSPRNLRYLHEAIIPFLAFMLPASFALVLLTEYILGAKKDGTYQFGLLAQFRLREIDWDTFLSGILEWLVRCIFLLVNFFAATYLLSTIRANGLPSLDIGFVDFIIRLDGIIFTLILFSILPGYVFASRLIGTEVKKVDRTWFGWAVTLAAYSPLNAAVFTAWMRYTPPPEVRAALDGLPAWAELTSAFPPALYALGALIIIAALFHLWGEALLGIRSANLSMRGVITTGPFRITKHPVYVSKCVQWAFIYLPVLNAVGILGALQSGLLFAFVCILFAARALAEEKLLAEDPTYVRYALFMDEKGLFAFLGRLLPFMRFSWRYDFWKRNGYLA
jgi:protein-S-isoprenylcysteine O-methyltransferase Ste14